MGPGAEAGTTWVIYLALSHTLPPPHPFSICAIHALPAFAFPNLHRHHVGFLWEALMSAINPLTAAGVVVATAATDAVYVMFTSAVVARRRIPAATWSSFWYLLSSYAVISYTENWIYVAFAAAGSWIGAFASITFLQRPPPVPPPVGAAPH
jgi:hypothetical protein